MLSNATPHRRRSVSPGTVNRLAAIALVGIFAGLCAFVVITTLQGRETRREVATAQELSAAYSNARLAVAEAEAAAHRFNSTAEPEARVEFEAAAAKTQAALAQIMTVGGPDDRAFIVGIFKEFLPALSTAQQYFNGELVDESALPDASLPHALRELLREPAEQQLAQAAALNDAYENQQQRNLWFTLGLYSVGLVLVVALLFAARAYGRRELAAASQLAQLREVALTDSLTGLGNRRAFEEEMVARVAAAQATRTPLTLAILDVDEFKVVNDTWGHERGDDLLRTLARSLRENCRATDRLFRVGGDEFAVIFPNSGMSQAIAVVDRIRTHLAQHFEGDTTTSAGVAELTRDCDDESLLRQEADAALYEAKLRGRDLAVGYDRRAQGAPLFPAAKLQGLRRLLTERELSIYFQPIRGLRDGAVLAYEALARMDPQFDLDGPMQAFQLAERVGRVAELDALCRERILAGAAGVPDGADLFVNISPFSLAHASFSAEALKQDVMKAGLSPHRVVLEITERSPVPPEVIANGARELREQGFRIALDDVGSGNNGLEMLQAVKVDFVKVDAGIVRAAGESSASRAALMAILVFAAEADAMVVAEGVEDRQILAFVHELAVGPAANKAQFIHGVQGFLLGRPVPGFGEAARAA